MNQSDLAKYRRQLLLLSDRMRTDAAAVTEQAWGASGGQAGGELSNAPMHLGDRGTEEYLFDLNAALLENEEYLRNEAADAIRRIDDGTFGRCEECETEIAAERLEALPYTRYCVRCAAEVRAGREINVNQGRPHGPEDTLAPEGAMGEQRVRRRSRLSTHAGSETVSDGGTVDHGAGDAGGGTAVGGLAGTNQGHGDPDVAELEDAMGSGRFDSNDARNLEDEYTPKSGRAGGAVGGTPAGKRAK